jgi:hypothetical protein
MLSRLLRMLNCRQLCFAASCGRCDLPQLMHACHCGHINSAPSAMLRPRVSAAAGALPHHCSVHDSSTAQLARSSRSAQHGSRQKTGCRTAYRRAAAAAMHNTVRGGLCKGAPLDTTQPSTTNIRWSPPHVRACSALILPEWAWPHYSIMAATHGFHQCLLLKQQPIAFCRFPFAEPLTLHSGEAVSSAQVIEAMAQFMGPERLARMDQVSLRPLS